MTDDAAAIALLAALSLDDGVSKYFWRGGVFFVSLLLMRMIHVLVVAVWP